MPAAISRSLCSPRVVIALCMILCIVVCAVFANRIAPNDPGDQKSAFDFSAAGLGLRAVIPLFRLEPTVSGVTCSRG